MTRRETKLLCAAIGMLALLPAGASAAIKTYGGTAEIGGTIALDVKLNKKGVAKRIIEIRAAQLPGTCETSGPGIPLNTRIPVDLKVSKKGKFQFEYTDEYGNRSHIDGKFSGRKDKRASGTFIYANHFPAEGPYPEEDCTTAESAFTVKKGGPDVPPPSRAARR